MRISVVVPALDAEATIAATLAALAAQELVEDYEVIVVDGGSTDGTRELLAAAGPGVRVLHGADSDPGSSRNLGAAHADGEVLAFTDADCLPDPGWLAAGLRALARADLVQGRVRPVREPGRFERTISVGAESGLYETANLFVTRAAFDRAGGFAPLPGIRLPAGAHFGEDAWFAWRCKRAGARSGFAADAVVRHAVFPRGALEAVAEQRRCALFPVLVAAIPELRGAFLHHRVFLSPATERFDLALAGLASALVTRRRAALLLALPWCAELLRDVRRAGAAAAAGRAAADTVTFAALAAGSLRRRTPVL